MYQHNLWAIEPSSVALLAKQKAQGVNAFFELEPTQLSQVGGVAVLDVIGPLSPYFSWFGANTSFLQKQITLALNTPEIKSIVLNIDSPGSSAIGMTEFSDWVFQASQQKPIYSYCRQACSGALLLAAATQKIFVSEASLVGSVGVIHYEYKDDELVVVTSKNAPLKNMTATEEQTLTALLKVMNDLEDIFVGRLAQYRNIKSDTILSTWGQGSVMTGSQALNVGMADQLLSLDKLIENLTMDTNKDMDVSAIVQNAIAEQAAATQTAMEAMMQKFSDKFAAQEQKIADFQVQNQKYLADLQAKNQAELEAEVGRKQDIENLFAIVANETQYASQYNALKADCLADSKIDVESARLKILALQATFTHQPVQNANIHQPQQGTQTLDAVAQQLIQGGMTRSQAYLQAAIQYPELQMQYVNSANPNRTITWANER